MIFKKLNFFLLILMISIITTFFLSCGNNEADTTDTIPLYEIENGDTIEVQHKLTATEKQDLVFLDGYAFNTDFGSLSILETCSTEDAMIKRDIKFYVDFMATSLKENVDIKFGNIILHDISDFDAKVFIHRLQKNTVVIIFMNDSLKQAIFMTTGNFDVADFKSKNEEYKDYSDAEVTEKIAIGLLKKERGQYMIARNFISSSNIITR